MAIRKAFASCAMWLLLALIWIASSHAADSPPLIVAHRGASVDAPENTIAAFELAWEQGADAIEGDFRQTEDGHIVCIHDESTGRVSDRDLVVRSSSLESLRKLDVGSYRGDEFSDQRIPTLSEVLATVPDGKSIYIEIKTDESIIPDLLDAVAASSLDDSQIIIISFDSGVIREMKGSAPQYKVCWLSGLRSVGVGRFEPSLDDILETLDAIGADGFSSSWENVDSSLVAGIIERGYEYHAWTVNDPEAAIRLAAWGVSSIITDTPATLATDAFKDAASESIEDAVLISNCDCMSSIAEQVTMDIDACSASDCISRDLASLGIHMSPISWHEYTTIFTNKGEVPEEYASCFLRTLEGDVVMEETWDGGLQQVDARCHAWWDHIWDGIAPLLSETGAVTQDNISTPSFMFGGISEEAHDQFRAWLADRYAASQLAQWGIADFAKFDVASYLLSSDLANGNEVALEDPVYRALVLYEYASNLEAWANMQQRATTFGADLGIETRLFGNQGMMWVQDWCLPYAALLSQYNPIVEIEHVCHLDPPPPYIRWSLVPKIGRASALDNQPIWVRGIIYDWETDEPYFSRDLYRLAMSETYAHGARRILELVSSTPHGDFLLPGDVRDGLIEFAQWVKRYGLFDIAGEPESDVALVYSVPSLMWGTYPPTGNWNRQRTNELTGWSHLLEEEHVPHDVVLFGHPELWDDQNLVQRLCEYQVIILPMVDCLSDEQVHALQAYCDQGGRILASGDFATRDENYQLRDPAQDFPTDAVVEMEGGVAAAYNEKRLESVLDVSVHDRLRSLLLPVLGEDRTLTTDAGQEVSFSLLRGSDGNLQLHVLNYEYELESKTITPSDEIEVSLALSDTDMERLSSVYLFTPDAQDALPLAFTVDSGRVHFQLPGVRIYSVVCVGDLDLEALAREKVRQAAEEVSISWHESHLAAFESLDGKLTAELWRDAILACETLLTEFRLDQTVRRPDGMLVGRVPHAIQMLDELLYVFDRGRQALLAVKDGSTRDVFVATEAHNVVDMATDGESLLLFAESGKGWKYDPETDDLESYPVEIDLDGEVLGVAFADELLFLLAYGVAGPVLYEVAPDVQRTFSIADAGLGELLSLDVWNDKLVCLDYMARRLYQLNRVGSSIIPELLIDLTAELPSYEIADGGLRGMCLTNSEILLTSISYDSEQGVLHRVEVRD